MGQTPISSGQRKTVAVLRRAYQLLIDRESPLSSPQRRM